jgi:hypothetical protein
MRKYNCDLCQDTGLISIYGDFDKPYEECTHEANPSTIISILPMFDEVKHFDKIENGKSVKYHAYYLKGNLQKILTEENYKQIKQEVL